MDNDGRSSRTLNWVLGSALIVLWVMALVALPTPHSVRVFSLPWLALLLSFPLAIAAATLLAFQHGAARHLANSHYVFLLGLLSPTLAFGIVAGYQVHEVPLGLMIAGPLVVGAWTVAHLVATTDARPMGALRLAVLGWLVASALMRAIPPVALVIAAGALVALWLAPDDRLPARVAPSSGVGFIAYVILNVAVLIGPGVVVIGYFAWLMVEIEAGTTIVDPLLTIPDFLPAMHADSGNFWALEGARFFASIVALLVGALMVLLWPEVKLSRLGEGLCSGLVVLAAGLGGHASLAGGGMAAALQLVALVLAAGALAQVPRRGRATRMLLGAGVAATVMLGTFGPTAPDMQTGFIAFLADSTWLVLLWLVVYVFALRPLRREA